MVRDTARTRDVRTSAWSISTPSTSSTTPARASSTTPSSTRSTPRSFLDSNGDGIGDLRGVIEKLDYLQWLGIDVIWFNPSFASPFRNAGYGVLDNFTTASRYGTNEDMVELIVSAAARGIRVLLDLVAGHTSVDHPWLVAAASDPADDRYIWATGLAPIYR